MSKKTFPSLNGFHAQLLPAGRGADVGKYCLQLIRECDLQAICFIEGSAEKLERLGVYSLNESKRSALNIWLQELATHFIYNDDLKEDFGAGTTVLCGIKRDGEPVIVSSIPNDELVDFIRRQMVLVPFRTHFGTGNGGKPLKLTRTERLSFSKMSDQALLYLLKFGGR